MRRTRAKRAISLRPGKDDDIKVHFLEDGSFFCDEKDVVVIPVLQGFIDALELQKEKEGSDLNQHLRALEDCKKRIREVDAQIEEARAIYAEMISGAPNEERGN